MNDGVDQDGERTVFLDQLSHCPHESDRARVPEPDFALPVKVRITQRITFPVVFPAENLRDESHSRVDFATSEFSASLRVFGIPSFCPGFRFHDEVDGFLLVFVSHAHSDDDDEGNDPFIAALGGFKYLLELVEDDGHDALVEAVEEEF